MSPEVVDHVVAPCHQTIHLTNPTFQAMLGQLLDEFYMNLRDSGKSDHHIAQADFNATSLASRLIRFRWNLHYICEKQGWHFLHPESGTPQFLEKLLQGREIETDYMNGPLAALTCSLDKGESLLRSWRSGKDPEKVITASGLHWLVNFCSNRQTFRVGILMSAVQDPQLTQQILLEQECSEGRTALHWAISRIDKNRLIPSNPTIAYYLTECLLLAGADPNRLTSGYKPTRPICIASALQCDQAFFRLLLDRGAKVSEPIPDPGLDAIAIATSLGDIARVKYIAEVLEFFPADKEYVNVGNLFALAVLSGDSRMIEYMAKRKVNPRQTTKKGLTPLQIAINLRREDAFIQRIVKAGGYEPGLQNINQILPAATYPTTRSLIDKLETEARNLSELSASRNDANNREFSPAGPDSISLELEITDRYLVD